MNNFCCCCNNLKIILVRWNALDKINDDNVQFLNEIRPSLKKSFNLAAYANVSDTLQQLVKLNVNLSTIEKDLKLASFIVRCDFEKDIQPLLMFLMDNGLNISQVGDVLTLNPYLFTVNFYLIHNNKFILICFFLFKMLDSVGRSEYYH